MDWIRLPMGLCSVELLSNSSKPLSFGEGLGRVQLVPPAVIELNEVIRSSWLVVDPVGPVNLVLHKY
jgi:hypothetical protein